jgi:hypothetical protein
MRRFLYPLVLLLLGTLACASQSSSGRYLYVVRCDAVVDKLDTRSNPKAESYELARRPGAESLIPEDDGTLDGCLANQAAFDPDSSIFYTIVPTSIQTRDDGTMDYRVLGFSVPALRLVKTLPGGESLDLPPHLVLDSGIRALKDEEWSPQTDLDLSKTTPNGQPIPNQILESSGDAFLLRIFGRSVDELILAVAHRGSKDLVRLQGVPSTVAPNVHLAPGGDEVMVEVTAGGDSISAKTGTLALFDARTGQKEKELSDPHVKSLYYLAISPSGKAIYHSNHTYWFVDLGETFDGPPVTRPLPGDNPGLFFADQ